MADIIIKKQHSLPQNKVLQLLKPSIKETARQYGCRLQWTSNGCKFYGAAQGILKINQASLIIAVKLGLLAKLNRREIESEITRVLESVLD